MHLAIVIVAIASYYHAIGRSENEQRCYSHFDYEYKVMEKLFECETALKNQREINAEQKEINVKVKGALHDLKTTNDNSETGLNKHLGVNVESKDGLDDLGRELEIMRDATYVLKHLSLSGSSVIVCFLAIITFYSLFKNRFRP